MRMGIRRPVALPAVVLAVLCLLMPCAIPAAVPPAELTLPDAGDGLPDGKAQRSQGTCTPEELAGPRGERATLYMNKTSVSIGIDGNWNANEWASAKCYDLTNGAKQCLMYIAFDATKIYVGADVIGDVTQDTLTSEQEVMQIAFDGENDGKITYTNPTGTSFDVVDPLTQGGPCVDRWAQVNGWNSNNAGWINLDGSVTPADPQLWNMMGEYTDQLRAGFSDHRFYEYSMPYNRELGKTAGVSSIIGINILINDGRGDSNSGTFTTRGSLPSNWANIGGPWAQFAIAQAPEAHISQPVTGSSYYVGDQVPFDATGSTDDELASLGFAWQFDDGGTANGATVNHMFNTAGVHNITLTVTDSDSLTNLTRTSITLRQKNAPPVIESFWPSGDLQVYETENVSFGLNLSDPNIGAGEALIVNWSVGGSQKRSEHGVLKSVYGITTYYDGPFSAGKYLVEATVQDTYDGGGEPLLMAWNITVINKNRPPEIKSFQPTDPLVIVNENERVTFTIDKSDPDVDKLTVQWFLDNITQNSAKNQDTFYYQTDYNASGSHQVRVQVTDNLTKAERAWSIDVLNINRAPTIDGVTPPGGSVRLLEGKDAQFSIGASDPDADVVSIQWYRDTEPVDGATKSSFTFKAVFEGEGSSDMSPYTVKVVAQDKGGLKAERSWEIIVEDVNRAPVPVIKDPAEASAFRQGANIRFGSAGSYDPDSVDNATLQYAWDFGDGKTASTQDTDVTHKYDKAGPYRIVLTVRDRAASATASVNITITVPIIKVEEITLDREANIKEGDLITISVRLANTGDADAGVLLVKLASGGVSLTTLSYSDVKKGDSVEMTYRWLAVKGANTIAATIDPVKDVTLLDGGTLTKQVTVKAKPSPPPPGPGPGGMGPWLYILIAIVLVCVVAGAVAMAMRKKRKVPKPPAEEPAAPYAQQPAQATYATQYSAPAPQTEVKSYAPPSCPRCGGPSPAMGLFCENCTAADDVENKAKTVEGIIKRGVVIPSASQMLTNARAQLAMGHLESARKMADKALKIAHETREERTTADDAIHEAEAAVADGRRRAVDIFGAEGKLAEALEALKLGRYTEARKAAFAAEEAVPEGESVLKCPVCGKSVELGWRVCPTCNSELTFVTEGEEDKGEAADAGAGGETGAAGGEGAVDAGVDAASSKTEEQGAAPAEKEEWEGLACPSCGAAVEAGWNVCPECNSKLTAPSDRKAPNDEGETLACPACAEPVQAGWRVCPTCNTSLITGEVVTQSKGVPGLLCTACGAPVEKDWRLCPDCGAELGTKKKEEKKRRCPVCGKEVVVDWKMCPFCDSPLDIPKEDGKKEKKKELRIEKQEAKTGTGRLDSDIGLTKARMERLEAQGKNVAKARNLLELTINFQRAGNSDKAEKYLTKTRNILDSIE